MTKEKIAYVQAEIVALLKENNAMGIFAIGGIGEDDKIVIVGSQHLVVKGGMIKDHGLTEGPLKSLALWRDVLKASHKEKFVTMKISMGIMKSLEKKIQALDVLLISLKEDREYVEFVKERLKEMEEKDVS